LAESLKKSRAYALLNVDRLFERVGDTYLDLIGKSKGYHDYKGFNNVDFDDYGNYRLKDGRVYYEGKSESEWKMEANSARELHARILEMNRRAEGERGTGEGVPANFADWNTETFSGRFPFLATVFGSIRSDLLSFFADRLKVHLRETGARHDLIDAVFALPGQDDLLMIVRRVEALGKFLDTDDGQNLLVGYRRAANILRDEEKRDAKSYDEPPDAALIARGEPEEQALFAAMQAAEAKAREAVAAEDFEAAMRALAKLRPAVDAFFDKVTVNADDPALRENRLKLLNMLRQATLAVADFSRIGG
jgi:hypothetical protein